MRLHERELLDSVSLHLKLKKRRSQEESPLMLNKPLLLHLMLRALVFSERDSIMLGRNQSTEFLLFLQLKGRGEDLQRMIKLAFKLNKQLP